MGGIEPQEDGHRLVLDRLVGLFAGQTIPGASGGDPEHHLHAVEVQAVPYPEFLQITPQDRPVVRWPGGGLL